MNRLWVVESAFTTTGAMADHRLPLPSGRIGALALALGRRWEMPARRVPGQVPSVPQQWIAALAQDLKANAGHGLVVAGRDQPPAVHALALAINAALGNLGTTVTLREPVDVLAASTPELAALAAAMAGGAVSTLVILGGNPVYDAPADLDVRRRHGEGGRRRPPRPAGDETAAQAHWHLPEAHFLEAWGDAARRRHRERGAAADRAAVRRQVARIELLALCWRAARTSRATTWCARPGRGCCPAATADASRSLRQGAARRPPGRQRDAAGAVVAGAVPPRRWPARPRRGRGPRARVPASPAVHDGRYANNAWLQELPEPVTKSPGTTRRCSARRPPRRSALENGTACG